MAITKVQLQRQLGAIETCAKSAWEHCEELKANVDALYEKGDLEAALRAQLIWQTFDSALQMAGLNDFR